MLHKMRLYNVPFESIQSERKTVEVRLNDEKRRSLQIGDEIEFTKLPNQNQKLRVQVIGLKTFPTFKEMYESIPSSAFDTQGESIQGMVENTYQIYTPEQEKKWGTLAIEMKLLDKN
ncbi:ASCH domain-containing protein [Oceanobacillus halophilus]|uniref:ASCH domain-containing protein n=1 Tax=Oceanobacillus halophilus TaxID=930130 RepID=A0A495A3V9_9BACI|nr:ASCH domain-containing protein [Oceanobacillus halophilus]RKQ34029.1 ASCH domain-containing protein [Oceanobacillus halophilus]